MDLLIVESPNKAKTIGKYLGSNFIVLSSLGHIMDLPSKNGSVLPEEDFKMIYEISAKAEKYVSMICKEAKKAKVIYIGTDPDREGEAIASNIAEVINDNKKIRRVSFNEVTKKSVLFAIENSRAIDEDLVHAQKARRALDYLVGFTLSPVLWRKLPGCRSAGRVQSVALRLICEREDEIEKFKSEEYWDISVLLKKSDERTFYGKLSHFCGNKLEKFSISNEQEAYKIVSNLENNTFVVEHVEKKQKKRNPVAPFTTSTLQQESSRKLGFSTKKTMQIAQKLYEGIEIDGVASGLITYMRTDGVTISADAIDDIRTTIKKLYGKEYCSSSMRQYQTKTKNAQEAHEAIRPTDIRLLPTEIKRALTPDQFKLYELIWRRTIASQMSSAILDVVSVKIKCLDSVNESYLKASGSVISFHGFYIAYKEGDDDRKEEIDLIDEILPPLQNGEVLSVVKIDPKQHFTEPPPRYSEASLVKKMEEIGIGRPSTYAAIISVLQERQYVQLTNKRLVPESKGRLLTAFLIHYFAKYVECGFTAELENDLDNIACGKLNWKALLRSFWSDFNENIKSISEYSISDIVANIDQFLERQLFGEDPENSRKCLSCGNGRLGLKFGRFGAFIGCSNYPTCNYTKKIASDASDEESTTELSTMKSENSQVVTYINDKPVYMKVGPYGPYLQLGEKDDVDMRRVAIPKEYKPDQITDKLALALISMPRNIGEYNSASVTVHLGKFGPYVKNGSISASIPKNYDYLTICLDDAIKLIQNKINNKS